MSAAKETKTENPLFSRNIPAAPPISPPVPPATEPEQSITVTGDQGKTVKRRHSKTVSEDQGKTVTDLQGIRGSGYHSKTVSESQGSIVSGQNGKTAKRQSALANSADDLTSENATVELSLYLRPSQDDKLEDLRREYKRLMKKKISANEVIRRLIDKATINDLF